MYGFAMNTLKDRVMIAFGTAKQSGRKVSQTELAKQSGVTKQAVSQWFSGKTAKIDGDILFKAAKYLDVRPEWLAGTGGDMRNKQKEERPSFDANVSEAQMPKQKLVPLISWVQAGSWSNDQTDFGEIELVTSVFDTGENGYALTVEGESMMPRYMPRDIIYINPDIEPIVGRRVIASCNNNGKTFKELATDESGRLVLKALNADWHPRYIPVDDECQIIGVVVGSIRPE